MTYFMAYLKRIRWILLLILIVGAPFHAFLITWLKDWAGEPSWVTGTSAWREGVVLLIALVVMVEILLQKKWPRLDWLDWCIVGYALLGAIFFFFQENKMQWLLGLRFDVIPFLFYIIVRHAHWEGRGRLVTAALIGAGIVVIFGLFHALLLPQNFLTSFGYSQYKGQFEPSIALSACQHLEHTERFCRAVSTFGGPTRYGTYLLFIVGLLLPFLVHKTRGRIFAAILFGLTLLSIVLTYSRSIWIGTLGAAIVGFFCFVPKKIKWKFVFGVFAVAFLAFLGWKIGGIWDGKPHEFPPPLLRTIFVRESSTNEHWILIRDGFDLSQEHPLGMGLGTVGPASVRFKKILTENWYLQIAAEMGVVGAAIFIAFFIGLLKKLSIAYGNWSRRGLFLSLLAIAIAGLFTHSFEETSTVLVLMAFAGMFVSPQQFEKHRH